MAILKADYLELVKKSYSFKEMDALEQARILSLEGEDMDYYAQLYMDEEKMMKEAAAKFVDESEKVIEEFKIAAKKDTFKNLKNREEKARKSEEKNLNNLLNNI